MSMHPVHYFLRSIVHVADLFDIELSPRSRHGIRRLNDLVDTLFAPPPPDPRKPEARGQTYAPLVAVSTNGPADAPPFEMNEDGCYTIAPGHTVTFEARPQIDFSVNGIRLYSPLGSLILVDATAGRRCLLAQYGSFPLMLFRGEFGNSSIPLHQDEIHRAGDTVRVNLHNPSKTPLQVSGFVALEIQEVPPAQIEGIGAPDFNSYDEDRTMPEGPEFDLSGFKSADIMTLLNGGFSALMAQRMSEKLKTDPDFRATMNDRLRVAREKAKEANTKARYPRLVGEIEEEMANADRRTKSQRTAEQRRKDAEAARELEINLWNAQHPDQKVEP